MKNARFWTFENNAAVKLTLRPGQTLTHFTFQRDDEGYHASQTRWTHDGKGVDRSDYWEGRDCDGVTEGAYESYCALRGLHSGPMGEDGTAYPDWKHGPTAYRDHSAEAMGY